MTNYVAYYRVSTKEQGRSGLGIEAQQEAVANSLKEGDKVVAEYTEIETGTKRRNKQRPELHKALDYCKAKGHTLIISKLDRLSRSVSFVFQLRESGVDFIALDLPEMTTFTLGIMMSMAQHEAELISERTKAALAAKKARGCKLGSPQNLTRAARKAGVRARQDQARRHDSNKRAYAIAADLKKQGLSIRKIAKKLNEYGCKSSKGSKFYPTSVVNLFRLYREATQ